MLDPPHVDGARSPAAHTVRGSRHHLLHGELFRAVLSWGYLNLSFILYPEGYDAVQSVIVAFNGCDFAALRATYTPVRGHLRTPVGFRHELMHPVTEQPHGLLNPWREE